MRVLEAVFKWLADPRVVRHMWLLPPLPRALRRSVSSPRQPWPDEGRRVPKRLRTAPGVRRDRRAEEEAFVRRPLQDFHSVHHEAIEWEMRREWRSVLPVAPMMARAAREVNRTARALPRLKGDPAEPADLTRRLKERARELGFGAVGVTRYEPKYTFAQHAQREAGNTVVICLLEQNADATEATPSVRSNRAAYDTESESVLLACRLAGFLSKEGYRARAHGTHEGLMIPYAVDAGLGQLGLNGQLLTPAAGSRCRIAMLTTEAPLVLDRPVDYGVHKVCDACQACVRRCPAGAIPATRAKYRGVEKAKINTARCYPVVARADGCGICMKVCPAQRFGITRLVEEFARTGRILGRDTDELEGYDWPLDGAHYGPGERPRLDRAFFRPPGFDPGLTHPQ
jgi:epoxyqueuosine reductase